MTNGSAADRDRPPAGVLPGLLDTRVTLVRSPQIVATLEGFRVWPQGVEFELHLHTHSSVSVINTNGLSGISFDLRNEDAAHLFELGVILDHQQTSNASEHTWPGNSANDDEPVLTLFGGGGGIGDAGGDWRIRWWLTPLPADGTVDFWCQWNAGGLPRCGATLDAQILQDAANRASDLGITESTRTASTRAAPSRVPPTRQPGE